MSEQDKQDLDKIEKEKNKSHGPERAEDSQPIYFMDEPLEKRMEMEKDILAKLTKKFHAWQGWRYTHEKTWDEIYRLYINQIRTSKVPTRSRISVPVIFQIIEAAVPKIVNVIFTQDESFFEVIPEDLEEEVEADMIQTC